MKKILLIYHYTVVEPLGVLFLADYLQRDLHEVDIIDYERIENEEKFDFGQYDYVGFSILTGSHNKMYKLADKIKTKTKVVMGGPHTLSFSKDCKEHANFVVRGFGERLFLDIVNGKIIEEGIYSEQIPPKDLLISNREKFYLDEKRRNNPIKNIIASFCCPYRCTYCYNSIVQKEFPKYKITMRPVDSVIEECKVLTRYPLKIIAFQDDYFGSNIEWLKEFVPKYIKEVNYPFHCNIRIEGATEERMKLFKEAGCRSVTFAIESATPEIRKKILNRHMTDEQIFTGVEVLRKFEIPFRTQQMLGLPTSTIDDDLELLRLNCKIKPLIAWTSIFCPIRGTPLGEYCVEHGLYEGKNDDIAEHLFSHSVLNFSEKRKKQIMILNRLFATLTHLPEGWQIAKKLIDSDATIEDIYTHTKNYLYDALYGLDEESAEKTRKR